MRFFDETAVGSLLNRFAADMSRVDGFLPDDLARTVIYSFGLASSVLVVASVTPVRLARLGSAFEG